MNCITAGNVLVQLFLQTQPKYFLNNKKLQYLLCIAQMARLSNGEELFEDDIRNLKHDFAIDIIADNFVYNSAIVEGKTVNDSLDIHVDNLIVPYNKKKIYALKKNEVVSEEDKKLLIDVFVHFGGFEENVLCFLLNEFEILKQRPVFETVSKEDITSFLTAAFREDGVKSNKILMYCYNRLSENQEELSVVDTNSNEGPVLPEVNNNVYEKNEVPKELCSQESKEIVIFKRNVLKKISSLSNITVNNRYCILVEVDSNKIVKDVCVVATTNNTLIPGQLEKLNDNIYQYSFVAVASDIRVFATIVEKN